MAGLVAAAVALAGLPTGSDGPAALHAAAKKPAPPPPTTPVLAEVYPAGGRAGTQVVLSLSGTLLGDAIGVLTDPPMPAELIADGATDAKVRCRLRIPADAPRGRVQIRLLTRRGFSQPRTIEIGDLPEVDESEPNDALPLGLTGPATLPRPSAPIPGGPAGRPATAGETALPLPVLINGRTGGTDVDVFALDLTAGATVGFDCAAERLGSTVEPVMVLLDPAGREVAGNEATAAGSRLGRFEHTPVVSGRHRLVVRDNAFGGGPARVYRLRIGSFPVPVTAFPAGGTAGKELGFEGVPAAASGTGAAAPATKPGDVAAGPAALRARITLPDRTGLQRVRVPVSGGPDWAEVSLHLAAAGDGPELFAVEPDNLPATAPVVPLPSVVNGRLGRVRDRDCVAVELRKGQGLTAEVFARRIGSPVDSRLTLLGPDGVTVATADDEGTEPDSRLAWTAERDGRHVLIVDDLSGRGGGDCVWRLVLRPKGADFALTVPTHGLVVRPGKPAELAVTVARQGGWDGAIDLTMPGLPAGLVLRGEGGNGPARIPANAKSAKVALVWEGPPATAPPAGAKAAPAPSSPAKTAPAPGSLATPAPRALHLLVTDLVGTAVTEGLPPGTVSPVGPRRATVSVTDAPAGGSKNAPVAARTREVDRLAVAVLVP